MSDSDTTCARWTPADVDITERIARAINEGAEDRWRDFLPAAKRVLLAIFEPTHAMYMHGGNAEPYNRAQTGRMRGRRIGDKPARDAWRLMINRALMEIDNA